MSTVYTSLRASRPGYHGRKAALEICRRTHIPSADDFLQRTEIASHHSGAEVGLCVLAPATYYEKLDLSGLAKAINEGLLSCEPLLGMPFSFCFTQFSSSFDIGAEPAELLKDARGRRKIWG